MTAELLPLYISDDHEINTDGKGVRMEFDEKQCWQCSACGHRIPWSNNKLDLLRYCWWCGAKFLKSERSEDT